MGDVNPFKRALVHIFEKNLDFTVAVLHFVTTHDVVVVDTAEDLDLAADLESGGVVMVAIDNFECEEFSRWTVNDLVDGATTTTPDSIDTLQLGEVKLLTRWLYRCEGRCRRR